MKKRSILSFLAFSFLSFGSVLPIGPLIGSLAAAPIFGGLLGAKSAAAKKTLNNADMVIWYVKLFLLALIVLVSIFTVAAIFRRIRKTKDFRHFSGVNMLLTRLHADLLFLKSSISQEHELKDLQKSKREILKKLLKTLGKPFFAKRMNKKLVSQIADSLVLIKSNKIDLDEQIMFVDQWQRKFASFVR